eukprot:COSAG01_NODE_281_length_19504_cov_129.173124_6_plen_183_part_00
MAPKARSWRLACTKDWMETLFFSLGIIAGPPSIETNWCTSVTTQVSGMIPLLPCCCLIALHLTHTVVHAVAGWGRTNHWDGRGGDQPRFTHISDNFVHEIGFFEKQSSFWFQAKTAQTNVTNNIIFNIPRAAIKCAPSLCNCSGVSDLALGLPLPSFNDGFGGDNHIIGNLIWNTCRESGDQ